VWVTVLHGRFAEKADAFATELKKTLNIAKLEVARISPVLGVHTGPGIVGAGIVPMELMGDLV
jgi:fatty acid-binding protein DegV